MSRLTPVFPPYVKPHRQGVYRLPSGYYSRWDGSRWRVPASTPDGAMQSVTCMTHAPAWRGLKKEPSK